MLPPDSRTTAFELIRAPIGYRLDFAVLTTYSLDLETLLALPLSVLAHPGGGLEELLADPLRLHQAIRDAGDRIHVFVDKGGVAIPRTARPLYSMLESSVHAVAAPNGGAFHPKVWVARFTPTDADEADNLLRVAILSRNLTFDRSWDVALASEAKPRTGRRADASEPLGALLRELPELATGSIHEDIAGRVWELADEARSAEFPAPGGFESPISFHALGLTGRTAGFPPTSGRRTLAIAPFVNRTGLDAVRDRGSGERILVSRQEALDSLSREALAEWEQVLVLSEAAHGESEDDGSDRDDSDTNGGTYPSGLHAKLIAIEHGWDVTWFVGSANLTAAAFNGSNVEMVASMTGRRGRRGGNSGQGIDRFLDGGFLKLCEPYQPTEPVTEDPGIADARKRLEDARDALMEAELRVRCADAGELWTLAIDGVVAWPAGDIDVCAWPVSIAEDQACGMREAPSWNLPVSRLTALIAFRLRVPERGVDDVRLVLRLPTAGMPEDRIQQILRSLLDSPEKFLRFLRALLGGLDALPAWAQGSGEGGDAGDWGIGLGEETLLDDLLRTAARDPERLRPVRSLIDDLRKTEEGRRIVPDGLCDIWTAVEKALARVSQP